MDRHQLIDVGSLPAVLRDLFVEQAGTWRNLSEDARDEVRQGRTIVRGRRTWGMPCRENVTCLAAVRALTGEIITGEKPTEIDVTELLDTLGASLEIPDGSPVVHGYGSIFDIGYVMHDAWGPYIETMDTEAFDKSLANKEIQISYLRSHNGLGLATTRAGRMAVDTDALGIGFVAVLNVAETDAADLVAKLSTGSTSTDTSVAGVIHDYAWNSDYDQIRILEWDMNRGEISSVHAGANPAGWAALRESSKDKSERSAGAVDLCAMADIAHELQACDSAL